MIKHSEATYDKTLPLVLGHTSEWNNYVFHRGFHEMQTLDILFKAWAVHVNTTLFQWQFGITYIFYPVNAACILFFVNHALKNKCEMSAFIKTILQKYCQCLMLFIKHFAFMNVLSIIIVLLNRAIHWPIFLRCFLDLQGRIWESVSYLLHYNACLIHSVSSV